MPSSDVYKEVINSQFPALHLLTGIDWEYLTPDETLILRGNKKSAVILEDILTEWLRTHNTFERKSKIYNFSEASIAAAVRKLKDINFATGLVPASEAVYELLTLGESFDENISGDKRSHSIRYIDWQNPGNNVYHITDEFSVERQGTHETRRPDLVLFVNGIPLAVIECKRADLETAEGKPVDQAITQMIRNQNRDEIPHLFAYTQLLLACTAQEVQYATTFTAKKFWAIWKEEGYSQQELDTIVEPIINRDFSDKEKSRMYDHYEEGWRVRKHFDELGSRLPTEQDRILYALLRPERLLELAYQFIVYDAGVKKIARYQQYFAVKETLQRIETLNAQERRNGGVIWHTTGSGKSLTMVMLAKALSLHPQIGVNTRVILVTDRIDLDDQITKTFRNCRKSVSQAENGKHLIKLVQDGKADIITTVIDKFEKAADEGVTNPSPNIFVLVDESHRSQYGTMNTKMQKVFKNGCYIGFTGTPLLKKDKTTAEKFGGFIHKYTMRQAVADQAVVPLLYDGRIIDLNVDRDELDRWFERRTQDLTVDQQADLKRKMSRHEEVNRVESRLRVIAYDIAEHYRQNFRGTGFKAQLATSSKEVAIRYHNLLKNDEGIQCEVIISAPDTREGNEEVESTTPPIVQEFWRRMMNLYGTEDNYNRRIKESFASEEGIELLIVVDKLLVGFDEPRNTVLYVDKSLRDHALLQAIARVNRLYEGKDCGYIIDYYGVLGQLNEALQTYNALENFDTEDVAGTITDVSRVVAQLPEIHQQLLDVFKTVSNPGDTEELERFLEPEDRRQYFYEALNEYARTLKVALSAVSFHENTPAQQISGYKRDLIFFDHLRTAVKQRYAETVNYGEYEQKIRKLMSDHVKATGVTILVENLDIFDTEKFDQAVEQLLTPTAKADTIANHARRTITQRMDQNPAFYGKLSQMIEETIKAYREGRLNELEYYDLMLQVQEQLRSGEDASMPMQLRQSRHAGAYYGSMMDYFEQSLPAESIESLCDPLAALAIEVETQIEARKVRDWVSNIDVIGRMKTDLSDALFYFNKKHNLALSYDVQGLIVEKVVDIAIKRDRV